MTRSELIARLAANFPQLTTKDADLAVKAILVMRRRATRWLGEIGLKFAVSGASR